MTSTRQDHWQLRLYLALRRTAQPVMRAVLRRRLRMGKEDPARMGEKLGQATLPRPKGRLVWFHAVGLGEVLALRPLIAAMQQVDPGLHALLTSTARSSARVIGANLPPGAVHQFLPLDGPDFTRSFLDHWRPDLSVWSEQDLWPGAICDAAARGIPLAYVNARMNAASYAKRARFASVYGDVLRRFALIAAQNPDSAAHLTKLGATQVRTLRSLKPAAEPLSVNSDDLATFKTAVATRRVWVAASTHAADEAIVIAAQKLLIAQDPKALLILAPRVPDRAPDIAKALADAGLGFVQRSRGETPGPDTQVLLADSFGELGLWYRLAGCAFVGASFGTIGGHNPWEAICLGVPVISGPDTANFQADYDDLASAGLVQILSPGQGAAEALAQAVRDGGAGPVHDRARDLVASAQSMIRPLAQDLLALIGTTK